MQLRGYHLGAAAALETRENADAPAAGVADRHDGVFNRDAAFALALLAQFNGFGRHPDTAAQALILHLLLDQHLAFIPVRGFAQRARYRARFFVLEFNDELPFGVDGIGDHACILYETVSDNTRYCVFLDER
jgi:hypothetical protein